MGLARVPVRESVGHAQLVSCLQLIFLSSLVCPWKPFPALSKT